VSQHSAAGRLDFERRASVKIYVASSWRNQLQPDVVCGLRQVGHDVYDFRNPTSDDCGFHWSEIDVDWRSWSPDAFIAGLDHPLAEKGFRADFEAMKWADACVLVLPCGRSAHLEAGWFIGAGKLTYAVLSDPGEPELMYKLLDGLFTDWRMLLLGLRKIEATSLDTRPPPR
jgi:hypothetical protein